MPRVLHALDGFVARSETFAYTYVTGHRRFEASVLCHSRLNADEFPFPDVHVIPKPMSRKTPAWWIAATTESIGGRSRWRRAVEDIVTRLRPAILHAHFGPIGCEMVDIARAAGVPLVTSLYGVDAAVLPYLSRWRKAYARLFEAGDLFLAEGPEMRKKLLAAGAPDSRTVLQPIALRLDRYPRWSPDREPTVLFVGRFVEKKGLPDAIRAFALARVRIAGARLIVVGAGPDETTARALIDRDGLEPFVQFIGLQAHAKVIQRLRQARALIHPSVTAADGDSEGGAPTILLEAQAIGTPIVTTRHADIPNVVPEGPGVFLCAEHDTAALADSLVTALGCRQPSSRTYVTRYHDISRAAGQLEDRYADLIAGRRPA
jgi:colanic acid/amylovoran biosynthesis glycosyltransferase